MRIITIFLIGSLLLFAQIVCAERFDHATWNRLLRDHVVMIQDGRASRVDYAGFIQDQEILHDYLEQLSAVDAHAFASWNKSERLAFLINTYNAFTIDLILTRYPKLDSIKDLGSFLRSPWKKAFVPLFGELHSLDDIEHGMIRNPGDYNEPRIHFAVNCASIGCPALLNEAFTGTALERQLNTATRAFLEDRTRNRYNSKIGRLEVSKIFDWYAEDFEKGWGGWHSLNQFLAHYSANLADSEHEKQIIAAGKFKVDYLDYDWKLNDNK